MKYLVLGFDELMDVTSCVVEMDLEDQDGHIDNAVSFDVVNKMRDQVDGLVRIIILKCKGGVPCIVFETDVDD